MKSKRQRCDGRHQGTHSGDQAPRVHDVTNADINRNPESHALVSCPFAPGAGKAIRHQRDAVVKTDLET